MQVQGSSHSVPFSNMQGADHHQVSSREAQASMTKETRQASTPAQAPNAAPAGMVTNLRALPGEHPAAWQQGSSARVADSEVTAESCYRPLKSMPFIIGKPGSMADRDNNIIGHQQIFFSDGTDIGYGSDGIMRSENKSEYSMCEPLSANKQQIMENVERMREQFEAEDYKLLENNCQDFVEKVTRWVN